MGMGAGGRGLGLWGMGMGAGEGLGQRACLLAGRLGPPNGGAERKRMTAGAARGLENTMPACPHGEEDG